MFTDYCTICGISKEMENSIPFFPLFVNNESDDICCYTKDGMMVCNYIFEEVHPNSNYPEYICNVCRGKLYEFDEFRNMAITTHTHITAMLAEAESELDINKIENTGASRFDEEEFGNEYDVSSSSNKLNTEMDSNFVEEEMGKCNDIDEDDWDNIDINDIITLKPEECNEAGESNTSPDHNYSSLKRNLKFRCTICWTVFENGTLLEEHMNEHPTCPICNRAFMKMKTLNLHLTKHSTEMTEEQHQESSESMTLDILPDALLEDDMHDTIDYDAMTENMVIENNGSGNTDRMIELSQTYNNASTEVNKTNIFKCDVCNRGYLNKETLNAHFQIHFTLPNGDIDRTVISPKFKCSLCGKEYFHNRSLRYHLRQIHGNRKRTNGSVKINQNFQNKNDAKHELNKLTPNNKVGEKFPCPICNRLYGYKRNLVAHLRRHQQVQADEAAHTNNNLDSYQCEICNRVYLNKRTLTAHLKMHMMPNGGIDARLPKPKGEFKCSLCDNVYLHNRSLTYHLVKIHGYPKRQLLRTWSSRKESKGSIVNPDENQKFPCPICKRTFASRQNVNVHLATHRPPNERPRQPPRPRRYVCTTCGKKFTLPSVLQEHEFRHKNERPIKCEICHKAFKMIKDLLIHSRIHTGDRKYICELCGKRFFVRRQLKDHMESHSDVPLYECKICLRKLKTRITWENHMAEVHKRAGQYQCGVCNALFGLRNRLTKHLKCHIRKGVINWDQIEDYIKYNPSLWNGSPNTAVNYNKLS